VKYPLKGQVLTASAALHFFL